MRRRRQRGGKQERKRVEFTFQFLKITFALFFYFDSKSVAEFTQISIQVVVIFFYGCSFILKIFIADPLRCGINRRHPFAFAPFIMQSRRLSSRCQRVLVLTCISSRTCHYPITHKKTAAPLCANIIIKRTLKTELFFMWNKLNCSHLIKYNN